MEHKKFSALQIGDDIFTIKNGWEKCTRIYSGNRPYPIEVGLAKFTSTGRVLDAHANASAWTYDPFRGTKPPREFVKGHWYPCIKLSGQPAICKYKGNNTFMDINGIFYNTEQRQIWIGKSLGVIEFPTTFSSLMDGMWSPDGLPVGESLGELKFPR